MSELKRFFRTRWVELLIAGVWLQSVISAVFTGDLALLALTTLGGLVVLAIVFSLVAWITLLRVNCGLMMCRCIRPAKQNGWIIAATGWGSSFRALTCCRA